MEFIKLKSSDDHVFEVELQVARQSVTIRTMLDDLGKQEEEDDEPIPLPNVSRVILEKVIEWATHHKDDPPYVENENAEKRTDDISKWDQQFLTRNHNELFGIILAANYLDIKALLDIGCKNIANLIKGKTPDEIRKAFNLPDRTKEKNVNNGNDATDEAAASNENDNGEKENVS